MQRLTARDIMTPEVVTVSRKASLREIGEMLVNCKISGVPVVDEGGKIVGIVSETDLLDETKRRAVLPKAALFGMSPAEVDDLMKAHGDGLALTAGDVMTKEVVTAREDAPVSRLAAMLLNMRINRIPICRDGRPVGIVSREDLLRALLTVTAEDSVENAALAVG